jgi:3',5'-cyclic AMP phosphodiesterase CpdA
VTLATATATPTTIIKTTESTVRIAAIGDVHLRNEIPESLAADLAATVGVADVLVLAGDITENGRLPEVELAAGLLAALPIPIVAVLGNHDRRCLRRAALRDALEAAGVVLLDGDAVTLALGDGRRVGFAGVGGYGGGFWPEEGPPLIASRVGKAVAVRARRDALRLQSALAVLDADSPEITVVVMHYAPTTTTLGNEPLAKHWMLGNSLLGSVVDGHEVDLVIHGHAHLGNQEGQTPGGVPVRNVAEQVVGRPMLYEVGPGRAVRNLDRVSHWTTTRSLPA